MTTETLAQALPRECSRARELLAIYKEIGPAGMFAAACIEHDLRAADQAMVSGDVVAMINAYRALEAYKS